jgi:hypothetical protein
VASVTAIRAGLAAALGEVPGLRVSTVLPRNVNCPMAIVTPESRGTAETGGGLSLYTFAVLLAVAPIGDDLERAQTRLDGWLDDQVIEAAIGADPTLGGACEAVGLVAWDSYADLEINGVGYLGVRFAVTVMA